MPESNELPRRIYVYLEEEDGHWYLNAFDSARDAADDDRASTRLVGVYELVETGTVVLETKTEFNLITDLSTD